MKLDEIKLKLPAKEKGIEKFYCNCENRKKFIQSDKENYKQHFEKAKHDLYRAEKEAEDKCWDWTIIKAYYAVHHAANSILLKKKGFFCKDHSCLIIALKYHNLIEKELFDELSKLHEKFADVLSLDLAFQLRKIGQYSVSEWQNLSEADASLILSIAKKFLSFVENA